MYYVLVRHTNFKSHTNSFGCTICIFSQEYNILGVFVFWGCMLISRPPKWWICMKLGNNQHVMIFWNPPIYSLYSLYRLIKVNIWNGVCRRMWSTVSSILYTRLCKIWLSTCAQVHCTWYMLWLLLLLLRLPLILSLNPEFIGTLVK